jgi:hypothetical protein
LVIGMKDRLPILILRGITALSVVAGILACIFALPPFGTAIAMNFPDYAFWQYPILVGLYAAALCFFLALVEFWSLLDGINKDNSLSAKKLKIIRLCSIAFSVLYYLSAMPVIYLFAEADDAPGAILIGAFVGLFPIGVAAFTAVLERVACGKTEEQA